MNNVGKLVGKIGLLSFLSVMPLVAEIDNGVDFTTTFPFYAGDTKLPAGQYKVSQPDQDDPLLLVESLDRKHSAFVEFEATHAAEPHRASDITFQKYGDTDYLNRVWIEGQKYGIKIVPSKVEAEAAADANAVQHSTVAKGE
jgi:hypothetical protein